MFFELPTDITLKPCPFCGGEAKLYQTEVKDYPGHYSYHVECIADLGRCGMQLESPKRYDIYAPKDMCIKMVTSIWNKRIEDELPRNSIISPHPVEPGKPRSTRSSCATCKHRCESVVSKSCRYCEPWNSTNSNWEDDLK